MTASDDTPDNEPIDAVDLATSRALDGDTDVDVSADRLEQFRAVQSWMTDLEPVDPALTDAAVAAALAVFDAEVGVPAAATPPSSRSDVVPLRRRVGAAMPWLGAVAAAGVLVVGVATLNSRDSGSNRLSDATATSGTSPEVEMSSADAGGGAPEVAPADGVGQPELAPATEATTSGAADTAVPGTERDSERTDAPLSTDDKLGVPAYESLADVESTLLSEVASTSVCDPAATVVEPLALLGGGEPTSVEIVQESDGTLVAYSTDGCIEVERLSP